MENTISNNNQTQENINTFVDLNISNVPKEDYLNLMAIKRKTGMTLASLIKPKLKELIEENRKYLPVPKAV